MQGTHCKVHASMFTAIHWNTHGIVHEHMFIPKTIINNAGYALQSARKHFTAIHWNTHGIVQEHMFIPMTIINDTGFTFLSARRITAIHWNTHGNVHEHMIIPMAIINYAGYALQSARRHVETNHQNTHGIVHKALFIPYHTIPDQKKNDCTTCRICVSSFIGLAITIYIRCVYGISGREITKYTVIYGVYIYGLGNPTHWHARAVSAPQAPLVEQWRRKDWCDANSYKYNTGLMQCKLLQLQYRTDAMQTPTITMQDWCNANSYNYNTGLMQCKLLQLQYRTDAMQTPTITIQDWCNANSYNYNTGLKRCNANSYDYCMCRVGQNHMVTVYIQYFGQNIYKYTVIYRVYIRFWPTLKFLQSQYVQVEFGDTEVSPRFLHEGIYWACVTLTTVGYGDFYPSNVVTQMLFPVMIGRCTPACVSSVVRGHPNAVSCHNW